jgi:hypothetical protein
MAKNQTVLNVARASYALFFGALSAGVAALYSHQERLALLPAAVVFGWSQIGGL